MTGHDNLLPPGAMQFDLCGKFGVLSRRAGHRALVKNYSLSAVLVDGNLAQLDSLQLTQLPSIHPSVPDENRIKSREIH
jgi:hypothetical protein